MNPTSEIDKENVRDSAEESKTNLQTTFSMSLDLNFKFPATAPDNQSRQARDRVNISIHSDEEGISRMFENLAARKARGEDFNQAFLAGWLGAYNHWTSSARLERGSLVNYQFLTRHGLRGPLGIGIIILLVVHVLTSHHLGLVRDRHRYQNPQQEIYTTTDKDLSHVKPGVATRMRWENTTRQDQ